MHIDLPRARKSYGMVSIHTRRAVLVLTIETLIRGVCVHDEIEVKSRMD